LAFSFLASNVYDDERPRPDALRDPRAGRLRTPGPDGGATPPGQFPFTRGNFATGYRGRLWTFRQYSGFGTPDAEILFDAIPLDKISTSFTINGTAAILLGFYVAAAEKRGIPRATLTGTIQNDILKEYASRGTWIWPPTPSLRLIADTIEFCAEQVPKFNAISVAGAHFRDAGASAVQEMAPGTCGTQAVGIPAASAQAISSSRRLTLRAVSPRSGPIITPIFMGRPPRKPGTRWAGKGGP
jgi:hypothetical protein